jgi:hypothetical protein
MGRICCRLHTEPLERFDPSLPLNKRAENWSGQFDMVDARVQRLSRHDQSLLSTVCDTS